MECLRMIASPTAAAATAHESTGISTSNTSSPSSSSPSISSSQQQQREKQQHGPKLPVELLLLIVKAVAPANPRLMIPPSHPAAQTLLALSRTCHATRELASRLLRERCMMVGPGSRLERVLAGMSPPSTLPFDEASDEGCVSESVGDDRGGSGSGSSSSSSSGGGGGGGGSGLPPLEPLQEQITALYLEPFAGKLADVDTARAAGALMCRVGQTLRRLVVRMPFASLGPDREEEQQYDFLGLLEAKRLLRNGFRQMEALTEFVCLGGYPSLPVGEVHTDIWRLWGPLERLVLFQVPLQSHWLWWNIATLPRLRHVVFACPERADEPPVLPPGWDLEVDGIERGVNIKLEYFSKLPREDARLAREVRVTVVDMAYRMEGLVATRGWEATDPEGWMTVVKVELPTSSYGDEDRVDTVTAWVRRGALDGSIWEWEGTSF